MGPEPERFYHGFGRYDVMLEPKDKSKKAVQSALAQIKEKRYETELLNKDFKTEQIFKYGFAFKGKEVLIG